MQFECMPADLHIEREKEREIKLYRSVRITLSLSICVPVSLYSISVSVSLSLCLSVYLSNLSILQSIHPSKQSKHACASLYRLPFEWTRPHRVFHIVATGGRCLLQSFQSTPPNEAKKIAKATCFLFGPQNPNRPTGPTCQVLPSLPVTITDRQPTTKLHAHEWLLPSDVSSDFWRFLDDPGWVVREK